MPPSAVHQGAFGMPTFPRQPSLFSRNETWSRMSVSTAQTAGRKRSRDEAAVNLDVNEAKLATIEPVKEKEDEWVYGEGMVLIKNPSSYISSAGSQSGTWLEEKKAADDIRRNEEARAINQQERPSLRNSKSQRLDMNAISVPGMEAKRRASPVRDANTSASTSSLSTDTSSQPIVDNYTLHLGIGWNRISNNDHIQAAARGWAKYIENHFPITNVRIQLESKGLQSYLVEASEGYFLFAENLRQGQFISRDLNQTFSNLKANPPVFEGSAPMCATESPKPLQPVTPHSAPAIPRDMEMDMS
ncbi:hypothetical protein UCREL1_8851 [Eutypa lata UCREL1]|uniref:Uncharacterized protein n=1 Tax=Eutypa lata (strain UCR-EL1) TaxID=1287681 RepID=M7SDB3_EUTLA|nr:hypothetical protein UCREL1_8851 [Eutypa lata UCREL1]